MGELIVTTTADSGDGSLRAAVAAAQDGDAIAFDEALNGSTITLASVIDVAVVLTIDGTGRGITLSGAGSGARLFQVSDGAFTVNGLTFADVNADGIGGAIYGTGASVLNAVDCAFKDCTALRGAAMAGRCNATRSTFARCSSSAAASSSDDFGGAIWHSSQYGAVFDDCSFEECTSAAYGGAFFSVQSREASTFNKCTFSRCSARIGGGVASCARLIGCAFVACAANEDATSSAALIYPITTSGGDGPRLDGVTFDEGQAVRVLSNASVELGAGAMYPTAVKLNSGVSLEFEGAYLSTESLNVVGSASFTGAGYVATPNAAADLSSVVVGDDVVPVQRGAEVADFRASRRSRDQVEATWDAIAGKTALLERRDGDAWALVDAAATPPVTSTLSAGTAFRLWDGVKFVESVFYPLTLHTWLVYARTIASQIVPRIRVVKAYLMNSSYSVIGETPIFFARLEDSGTSTPLSVDAVEKCDFSVYKTVYAWGSESLEPVENFQDVAVPLSSFLSELVTTDERWTVDAVGYNFIFEPDATTSALFTTSGTYSVTFKVTLKEGNPVPITYRIQVNE